jgi:hypothetical protein
MSSKSLKRDDVKQIAMSVTVPKSGCRRNPGPGRAIKKLRRKTYMALPNPVVDNFFFLCLSYGDPGTFYPNQPLKKEKPNRP